MNFNQFKSEKLPFVFCNGVLFIAHEAVERFDKIKLDRNKTGMDIPDMYYAVYKNIIAISLFNHEAYLFSNTYDNDHNLDEIENLLNSQISTLQI